MTKLAGTAAILKSQLASGPDCLANWKDYKIPFHRFCHKSF